MVALRLLRLDQFKHGKAEKVSIWHAGTQCHQF